MRTLRQRGPLTLTLKDPHEDPWKGDELETSTLDVYLDLDLDVYLDLDLDPHVVLDADVVAVVCLDDHHLRSDETREH
jgi:hypothetical protein